MIISPGFIDLHTHIRGIETLKTATEAAIAGGFTTICMMPNTIPPIDSVEKIKELKRKIQEKALVSVLPIPSIAIGMGQSELADIEGFAKEGVFAISDDGHTIHNLSLLREACFEAKRLGLLVILHAEEDGDEPKAIEKRIELAYLTGAKLHIAHISEAEGVSLVREAKKSRINVTTEATPHHFTLTEKDIKDTNFKVNPRLKSHKDIEAIKEGLADGTIDIIATDHAPHTKEAKSGGWDVAALGMVGLETCVGLVWTELVHKGVLSEKEAIAKLTINPAKIIGGEANLTLTELVHKGVLSEKEAIAKLTINPAKIIGGEANLTLAELVHKGVLSEKEAIAKITINPARIIAEEVNLTIIDPNEEWVVNPLDFKSEGKNTPFSGRRLKGRVVHCCYQKCNYS